MSREPLTIKEAADSLEVSPDTIRRRIKAGHVRAKKIKGPYGMQWVIDPDSLVDGQRVIEALPVRHNMTPEKLEDIIRQATRAAAEEGARAAIEEQAEQMKSLQEQIEGLRKQLDAVQDKPGLLDKLKFWRLKE